MTGDGTRGRLAAAALAIGLATAAAAAGGLARLPADYPFPQGDGSPGAVTFSHATHVDAGAPSCVGCHPGQWSMLRRGQAVRSGGAGDGLQAVTHEAMEKGQACGACHGKQAFGFESCDLCHK